MVESNGKILAMFEMVREDIQKLEKRINKLPCNTNSAKILVIETYINKKIEEEKIIKYTFIREIIKYAVSAIIAVLMFMVLNGGV